MLKRENVIAKKFLKWAVVVPQQSHLRHSEEENLRLTPYLDMVV
jgi:hypothetical protein